MGFTTPCFIRKNTQELRRGLEELGYEILNFGNTTLDAHNYDGKGSHKSIEEGKAIITSYGNLYGVVYYVDTITKKGRIDCGTNEELFLAIALAKDIIKAVIADDCGGNSDALAKYAVNCADALIKRLKE